MIGRAIQMGVVGGMLLGSSAWAACPKCLVRGGGAAPSTVVPNPDDSGIYTLSDFGRGQLDFGGNAFQAVSLGSRFTLGGNAFTQVNVFSNGHVSFGAQLPGARSLSATGGSTLGQLGNYVIAPFYSPRLLATGNSSVSVQQGLADLYANNGVFSRADAQPTTVITWSNFAAPDGSPVTFQLLLGGQPDFAARAATGGTGSAFAFRYGTFGAPGLPGSAIGTAGYVVDQFRYEYDGPFTPDANFLNTFEATPGALGLVPEPGSWAMLIAGFGVIGAWLRRRRPRRTVTAFA